MLRTTVLQSLYTPFTLETNSLKLLRYYDMLMLVKKTNIFNVTYIMNFLKLSLHPSWWWNSYTWHTKVTITNTNISSEKRPMRTMVWRIFVLALSEIISWLLIFSLTSVIRPTTHTVSTLITTEWPFNIFITLPWP